MRFVSGVVDQVFYFVAVDSTDLATRETGLTTFTVYRSRNGAASTAMTTPTVTEVDATNMPGVYKLLLDEDMTIGSGNDSEEMAFHITQASMAPVTRSIELYRAKGTLGRTLYIDTNDRVDVGEWLGTAVATPTVAGVPEVDLTHVAGATTNVTALATNVDAILTDTAEIGVAGAGLTNIDLPNQTMDITGSLSGSVGSVTGAVGSVTGSVGSVTGAVGSVTGAVGSLVGHTVQTGDNYTRLGAPAGASVSADIADTPTVAEFNARTIAAASYFDPAIDTVANVTTVGTTTTNTDMRGTDSALLASSAPSNWSDLAITVTSGQVTLLTATQASIDAIETDTGTTLQAELDAIQAAVITNAAGVDIAADIIAVKAETATIVADTNELQADDVPGLIAALNDLSSANVLTQVNAALDTAIAELGVVTPTATPTLRTGLMLLYMRLRNKLDVQTSAADAVELHNDAGTQIASKLITDDGSDYSEAKMT